jgi:hypothetical protein
MPALKIEKMGGMLPAWDDTNLPVSQAASAENCYLFSGALQGWRTPKLLRTLNDPLATAAFRVPTLTQAKATSILTFITQPNVGDFIQLGELVYTFGNATTPGFTVGIGGTLATTMANLLAALVIGIDPTADIAALAAASYTLDTYQNLDLSQEPGETSIVGSTIVVTATDYGVAYNTLQSTESTGGARLSFNSVTFTGGTNPTFTTDITSPATWLEFRDQYTTVLRSPIVDDQYNRIYVASPTVAPNYNTYKRIAAGPTGPNAPFLLGLNPPEIAPTVSVTAGGPTGPSGYPTSITANTFTPGSNTLVVFSFGTTGTGVTVVDVDIMPAGTADGTNNNVAGVTGAPSFTGVLYADAANTPGATGPTGATGPSTPGVLLATGSSIAGCEAGTAITSTFPTPVTLNPETVYWAGFQIEDAVPIQLADNLDNAGMLSFSQTYAVGAPSSLGPAAVTVSGVSIGAFTGPPLYGYPATIEFSGSPLVSAVPTGSVFQVGPLGDTFFLTTTAPAGIGDTAIQVLIPNGDPTMPAAGMIIQDYGVPGAYTANPWAAAVPTTTTAVVGATGPTSTPIPDLQMWIDTLTGATIETRAYVYTWVSAYEEESPPSPPTVQTGWSNGQWEIGMFPPPPEDLGILRNITLERIYRTITAVAGQTNYFQVTPIAPIGQTEPANWGDFPITQATFADSNDDLTISLNTILPSATWFKPPEGLEGFVSMPNGMIAGWMNNEIWFCEPYRPHAWPPGYVMTTEFPIVGLGVSGNSLIAVTNGTPYIATGLTPDSMTQAKVLLPEPCNSRASIVSTPAAVYYTSPNGLMMVTGYGVGENLTETWITREKWAALSMAKGTAAISLAGCYFAFGTVQGADHSVAQQGYTIQLLNDATGFTIWPQPGGHRLGFNKMTAPNAQDIYNVQADPWTGVGMLIQNGGQYYYDFTDQAPVMMPYTWRSKIYQQPSKANFEAMKLFFTVPTGTPAPGVRNTAAASDPSWNTLGTNQYAIIRVYADGDLVTCREAQNSGEMLRVLSGFKAEQWQWEISGQVLITNLQVATSARELGSV